MLEQNGDAFGSQSLNLQKFERGRGIFFDTHAIRHGYVRTQDGTFTSFDPAGSADTEPFSINDKGVIAGFYSDNFYLLEHGFVRSAKGKITEFDAPGAEQTVWATVNNKGAVAGSYYDGQIVIHCYLRNPDGSFSPEHFAETATPEPELDPQGLRS